MDPGVTGTDVLGGSGIGSRIRSETTEVREKKNAASACGSLFRVGIRILVFHLALIEAREVLLNYQFEPSIACADSTVKTDLLTLRPLLRILCGDDDRNLQGLTT